VSRNRLQLFLKAPQALKHSSTQALQSRQSSPFKIIKQLGLPQVLNSRFVFCICVGFNILRLLQDRPFSFRCNCQIYRSYHLPAQPNSSTYASLIPVCEFATASTAHNGKLTTLISTSGSIPNVLNLHFINKRLVTIPTCHYRRTLKPAP